MNQQALSRLRAAERRANQRDFNLRYGNQKRNPYGYSSAYRLGKRRSKLPGYLDELATLTLLAGTVVLFIVLATN